MNEVNWRVFEVEKIFEIVTGALLNSSDLKEGNIPRITATSLNNGISTFTKEIAHKNFRTYKNFISVSFLGDVFYQPETVSLDMKIHGLKIKNRNLNKELALYLIPLIKKFSKKYNYGNQLSTSVLARQKLLLPTKLDGTPNWEYMERYILYQKNESVDNVLKFLNLELTEASNFKSVNLKNVNWKEFKVNEIFKINRVTGGKNDEYKKGVIPYVTTSGINNGVTDYIDSVDDISKSKTLTINPIGSSVFYHDYNYVGRGGAGSSINTLELKKNIKINQYIGMFISVALSKNSKVKASYGVQLNGSRLKNMKFLLPANNNQPDYEFMENYIKGIKYNSIIQTIKFLEGRKNKQ